MQSFPQVILHSNKIHAVKRFHPWVFSGAIKKKDGDLKEGTVVEVYSDKGEYLGIGHYGMGSIAVRIFSFNKVTALNDLWKQKFESAYRLRQVAGLAESTDTNAYRLLNAEGDGMPGLIVDWYNGTAVIQAHSKGMYNERENFVEAIKAVYGSRLKAVYDKSNASMHHKPAKQEEASDSDTQHSALNTQHSTDSYLYGKPSDDLVLENKHRVKVDWVGGQKTGFFIDQRDNRLLLSKYAAGKKVLNTFCYSGGFSVYAMGTGAKLVHSVDSSAKAIEWTDENIKLNANSASQHQSFVSDVFDFMKDADEDYDIMVLDPPAFAKGQSARHSAIKAYTRLNHTAFKKIKSGGIVFTFSCSQAVNPEMFQGAVTAAAIESGRNIRILHHLTQPADHPVSIYHPEGLYLKGLVLYVE